MKAALFDAPRVHVEYSRCRELVPIGRERCRLCGGPVFESTIAEPALFFHGGYGATRQTTLQACLDAECRTMRVARVDEINPRNR